MDVIFIKIFNMSIAAGWLIAAVMVLRLFLKRAPKWLSCILWAIVAVRLLCPVTFESSFSLIPSAETIRATELSHEQQPLIHSGVSLINRTVNPVIGGAFSPAPGASVNPMHVIVWAAGIIWLVGMCAMFVYALASFWRLRRKLREAVLLRDNIWICDHVKTPFILGVLKPRIYLYSAMDSGQTEYVLAHEQAHLMRKDHWWKLLAYLLLAVYWFHPLVWAAYLLFCRDMELACDEKVIKDMDIDGKKAYANVLLACSVQKKSVTACPLAFGEVGVRERVKSVLHYKKPAFFIMLAAITVCAVVAVCFLTNPKQNSFDIRIVIPAGSLETFHYSEEEISPHKSKIVLWSGENLGDTEVVLEPVQVKEKTAYTPVYLTPGLPVEMKVEKGAWFRVGVAASNPTEEDLDVYVRVEDVDVRIEDEAAKTADWQAEGERKYDIIPMVMIDDKFYYDTGNVYVNENEAKDFDGEITSTVDASKRPSENNQSNFGAGYGYRYGEGDTVALYIDGTWCVFEYRREDGGLIRYHDSFYSTEELSDETIRWLEWYNSLPDTEQLAVSYVPSELRESGMYGEGSDTQVMTEDAQEMNVKTGTDAAAKAITDAILEKNHSSFAGDYDLACCDFVTLDTVPAAPSEGDVVTYYGWTLYEQYRFTEKGIEDVGGCHIPTALTFEVSAKGYQLKEYWEPRDGSYYAPDIRDKFPSQIAKDGIDSQKYIMQQKQNCYRQAVGQSGMDADAVIEGILEEICAEPFASSNPQDYIDAHDTLYRELLYYGEYTLRHCLGRFARGKETGLAGKIMALVCEELLQVNGEIPADAASEETGQQWYDALYAQASDLVEPYLQEAHERL